jgi:hypothetical protein
MMLSEKEGQIRLSGSQVSSERFCALSGGSQALGRYFLDSGFDPEQPANK